MFSSKGDLVIDLRFRLCSIATYLAVLLVYLAVPALHADTVVMKKLVTG